MLARVEVPYVDTSAAALGLWHDLPRQPALGTAVLDVGGLRLELRVLGASHQVVVAGGELTETVACLRGAGPSSSLPTVEDRVAGGLRHRFASRVVRVGAEELHARAAALCRRAADDPLALAGVFPGSPDAVTSIVCRPTATGAAWTTAHVYPRSGELVLTRATVEPVA